MFSFSRRGSLDLRSSGRFFVLCVYFLVAELPAKVCIGIGIERERKIEREKGKKWVNGTYCGAVERRHTLNIGD